ncbi:Ig-like domain-containing protein [Rhodococcus sp. IEGM 1379]|uniref:Ig-like domain-containing protein n=1 Tax=Rhodococcus sp. IEGM 1379 TaxID=3047086 RepID=UPI0024B75A69|nr:Ig-like domain-containing protein [Rhodococcus sp. IEGM 1379]MDI9915227.1 Ig-like domain-containing protein [Rhodococcus sp. IEGM 1379]
MLTPNRGRSPSTLESTSAPQTVTVSAAAAQTTTAISGSASAVTGVDVALTAQVSPNPGSGTVQFKDANGNLGGPVNVDADGKAVLTQAFAEGTQSITAVFAGSAGFLTSTSAAHGLTATAVGTVTVSNGDSGNGGSGSLGGNGGLGSLGGSGILGSLGGNGGPGSSGGS